jgi:beta-lactamase class A
MTKKRKNKPPIKKNGSTSASKTMKAMKNPSRPALLPLILIAFSCLVLGYIAGNLTPIVSSKPLKPPMLISKEIREQGYQFTSPLLDCGEISYTMDNQFTHTLSQRLNEIQQQFADITSSVYFRALKHGALADLNPDIRYSPASLSKIPIMIAYFKHVEHYPSILEKKLVYSHDPSYYDVIYKPKEQMIDGNAYTIENLIYRMIAFSDNAARVLLINDVFNHINHYDPNLAVSVDAYSKLHSDLLLESPDTENPTLTTREVASFFRILYNASYINRDYSERSLQILSHSTFNEGLRKGIPAKTMIAHKFGEDYIGSKRELHDCGIVYHTNGPYILCVMTRGTNNTQQAQLISSYSKTVFEEMNNLP